MEEAILLNTSGYLTEGSLHNLFWVRDKVIYTPDLECGVLSGITRKHVIDIATNYGFTIKESFAPVTKLINADEAFMTNSLRGIQPLLVIEGEKIHNGKPGPVTKKLQTLYQQYLKKSYSI